MQAQQFTPLDKGHGDDKKSPKLTVVWEIRILAECQDLDCANSWNWNRSPWILPYHQKTHPTHQKKHQRPQKGTPIRIIFITRAMKGIIQNDNNNNNHDEDDDNEQWEIVLYRILLVRNECNVFC